MIHSCGAEKKIFHYLKKNLYARNRTESLQSNRHETTFSLRVLRDHHGCHDLHDCCALNGHGDLKLFSVILI